MIFDKNVTEIFKDINLFTVGRGGRGEGGGGGESRRGGREEKWGKGKRIKG